MKIEFEQKSKQEVDIIAEHDGVRKVVGNIHTPANSARTTLNAIQVCGFTDAYDLWGCANFAVYKTNERGERVYLKPNYYRVPPELYKSSSERAIDYFAEVLRKSNLALDNNRSLRVTNCKDIQLMFPKPEEVASPMGVASPIGSVGYIDCMRCYSVPCSCENKYGLPYSVKYEKDLKLIDENEKEKT